MKRSRSGNTRVVLPILGVVLAVCLGFSTSSYAAFTASLDRYRIAMGETVRLTLSSDDRSDPADANLDALQQFFEIMERSSSVSTRIINGQRTQNRELRLELTPRREGTVTIPPFIVDGQESEALSVAVGPEPTSQAADEIVTFDAQVDRNEVYVQGQLLLTLRVQQSINLESRNITELEIDNAYVEDLGQNSFQRMIDGRPWLVHEIRYAIFPESSGEITIPAQTFSGRMGSGRRTLFDTRPSGRLIRRRSEALVIPVKQRPAGFPDATWLPAANVTIEEQWSGSLDQLQIGDSVTRTITLSGDGLQGAQLPPVDVAEVDGLRAYPDQAGISNVNGENGITGLRTESLALVAVSAGEYELPAVEVPWWDTQTDSLKVARLPARSVRVLVPASAVADALAAAPPANADVRTGASAPGYWPWIAALCALGWLLTGLLWWWRGRRARAPAEVLATPQSRESPKALLKSCTANNAAVAHRELRAWLSGQGHRGAIGEWLAAQESTALSTAVADLERSLYREDSDATPWDGTALSTAIRNLPSGDTNAESHNSLPPLYLGQ